MGGSAPLGIYRSWGAQILPEMEGKGQMNPPLPPKGLAPQPIYSCGWPNLYIYTEYNIYGGVPPRPSLE